MSVGEHQNKVLILLSLLILQWEFIGLLL